MKMESDEAARLLGMLGKLEHPVKLYIFFLIAENPGIRLADICEMTNLRANNANRLITDLKNYLYVIPRGKHNDGYTLTKIGLGLFKVIKKLKKDSNASKIIDAINAIDGLNSCPEQ